MNTTPHNMNKEQEQLTDDQLHELENDAVWSLLRDTDKSSQIHANPMFARNVMREIRLNHSNQSPQSFWNRLTFSHFNKIALSFGLAAVAALVVVISIPNSDSSKGLTTSKDSSLEELSQLDHLIGDEKSTELEQFTDEMLKIANEDPFYISEEEIEIAMQM